jgi:hypothetical protein
VPCGFGQMCNSFSILEIKDRPLSILKEHMREITATACCGTDALNLGALEMRFDG